MKIAFIGFEDIKDPFLWSGIPFTLYNKFKASSNVEVMVISSHHLKVQFPIAVWFKRFFYNKLLAYKFGVYRFDREDWCIKMHSKTINNELTAFKPDVILCCTAYQINQLKTNKPIFIFTDATFKLLNTYYTDYMRYCKLTVEKAELAEKTAFKKAEGIIFSSQWAKQSAIADYGISENKLNVLPFGSNLNLPKDHTVKLAKDIAPNNFSLVFVGYDYERKGLDRAVKIHQKLIQRGVNSKLTIIGPATLEPKYKSEYTNFIGKIDKNKMEDREKLLKAYEEAHFLILPTQIEAFGIVFCEAASLALPGITHAVGGTDEIIKNGINGIKLPLESSEDDFVQQLLFYIENNKAYQQLRKETYQQYCSRLNWDSTIKKMLDIFSKITAIKHYK